MPSTTDHPPAPAAQSNSLDAIATEAVENANYDPVEALRIAADTGLHHGPHAVVRAVADALGVPCLHGGFELVTAHAYGFDTEYEANAVRREIADFSDLWASEDAPELLANLSDDGDLAEALMARHRFLRPDAAQEIALHEIKLSARPPQPRRESIPGRNPFAERVIEPDAATLARHEKALKLAKVLGISVEPAEPDPAKEAVRLERRRQQVADWMRRYATNEGEPMKPQLATTDGKIVERYDPEMGTLKLNAPQRHGLKRVRFAAGMQSSPPAWLAKGLLPRTGLALLYGEGNAGKSFAAVHAALSVAWGVPMFGNRTKRGGVLYLAAEGGASVLPRFAKANEEMQPAVAAANLARPAGTPSLTRAPIEIVTEAPDLSRDGNPAPLIRTIRDVENEFSAQGERLALVVVDTWHRILGGADENSASDTGHALKPLLAEAERAGFLVLVIHHPGKEVERGARGSSALGAAADAIIAVTVPGHGGAQAKPSDAVRRCTVTKMRDGAAGGEFRFALDVHTVGHDEDGDPVTTCTVRPIEPTKRDDDGLSANDRQFSDAMRAALEEADQDRVSVKEVRLRFYASRPDAKPDANRKAFTRAFEAAISAGRIGTDSGEEFAWMN